MSHTPTMLRATRRLALIVAIAASAARHPLQGQTPETVLQPSPLTGDTAVLLVQGRPITVFRSSLGALSPAERAASAARRIEALADSEANAPVASKRVLEGELVMIGAKPVFTLTPGDTDPSGGPTLEQVAAEAVARLGVVFKVAREERSLSHLLVAVAISILATLLFLIGVRLLRTARRSVVSRLPRAGSLFSDFAVGGFTLLSTDSLLRFVRRLVDIVIWASGLFLAYLWLAYVLTRFIYTRPWGEALGTYLTTTMSRLGLAAVAGIPGLFTVVLIFIVARWISRVVTAFFDAAETGSIEVPWVHSETANPTKRIVVALIWMFALVVAYPYLPASSSGVFKGVSVFAGVVLSLGSSGIVSQAMSGLVLMYARALKPGDYVQIGQTQGTVTELGMLSTKIRTTKREEVTLPNAVVVSTTIMNYTRTVAQDGNLLYTSVTIGYDTPWRQVEGLLKLAATRTQGLRSEPEMFVLKTRLSDFYIEYQLNVAVDNPSDRIRALDRLHANILDAFNEYGVQITSPHYIADPTRPAVVPREKWHIPPAGEVD